MVIAGRSKEGKGMIRGEGECDVNQDLATAEREALYPVVSKNSNRRFHAAPVVVGKQPAKPLGAVPLPFFRRSKLWHDEISAPEQDPQQTENQRVLL